MSFNPNFDESHTWPLIYKSSELPSAAGPLPVKSRHHSNQLNPEQSKQKSQLCKQFMQYGLCPYEGRCKFAHGTRELLSNQQANVKYKTKTCQNYNKKGSCLYGSRCNFIHRETIKTKNKVKVNKSIELALIKASTKVRSRLLLLLDSQDL